MHHNVFFFLQHKNQVNYFYDYLTIEEGLALMKRHGYTCMPVIDSKGLYKGAVTEGDFLWHICSHIEQEDYKTIADTCVGDLVRPDFMPAVSIEIPVEELFEVSLNQNFVPVTDDRGIFIGIVTRQKILRYLLDFAAAQPIEEF